jgi:hypothetical protein
MHGNQTCDARSMRGLAVCLLVTFLWSGAQTATAQQWTDAGLDAPSVARTLEPWRGDLPGMRERRRVRALVIHDRTGFFLERGRPRGFEAELLEAWEERLNAGASRRDRRVQVVYVPLPSTS